MSILFKFLTLKCDISRTIWRIEVSDGSLFCIFHTLSFELNLFFDRTCPLTISFPDLKENQVIIPSTTKLTFNISLVGTDVNKTLVGNLCRNIVRKLIVKLEGNEIIGTDDYDILYSYYDCWNTAIIINNKKRSQLRDVMLSFKVSLKLMVKLRMLLNTG